MRLPNGYGTIRLARLFMFSAVFLGLHSAASAQSKTCSARQEDGADAALGNVRTWQDLIDWHRRFAGCDDASTAEGVSDIVAGLLAADWSGLMRQGQTFQRDHALHAFLVRHVDTAITDAQARQVMSHAATQCAAGNARLCKNISRAIEGLQQELKGH